MLPNAPRLDMSNQALIYTKISRDLSVCPMVVSDGNHIDLCQFGHAMRGAFHFG